MRTPLAAGAWGLVAAGVLSGCTVPEVDLQAFTFTCEWDDDCPVDAKCDVGRCVPIDPPDGDEGAPDEAPGPAPPTDEPEDTPAPVDPADESSEEEGEPELDPDREDGGGGVLDGGGPGGDDGDDGAIPDDTGPDRGTQGGACRLGERCDDGLECKEGICQVVVQGDLCQRLCDAQAGECDHPRDGCVASCRSGDRPPDGTVLCMIEEMEGGNCELNILRDCPIPGIPAVCNEVCGDLWDACREQSVQPCLETCSSRSNEPIVLSCLRERARARQCADPMIRECANLGGGFGDDGGGFGGDGGGFGGDGGDDALADCDGREADLDGEASTGCEALSFRIDATFGFGHVATNAPSREIWRWTDPHNRTLDVRPGPHGDIDGDGRPDPIFVAHDQFWGEEEIYMVKTSRLCTQDGPIRPTDEVCDGVDNNCDGDIDEGCEP